MQTGPRSRRFLVILAVLASAATGCDSQASPSTESPTSLTDELVTADTQNPAPTPTAGQSADMDWMAAVDATQAVSSGVMTVEVGIRSDTRPRQVTTVTVFDRAADAWRRLVTGDPVVSGDYLFVAETLLLGDTSWVNPWDFEIRREIGYEFRFIEMPTADLVAAGVIPEERGIDLGPLFFLAGVTGEDLIDESEERSTYQLVILQGMLQEALPGELEARFMAQFGDFLDPGVASALTGTASVDEAGRVIDVEISAAIEPGVVSSGADELFMRFSLRSVDEPLRFVPPESTRVLDVAELGQLSVTLPGLGQALEEMWFIRLQRS